jgi:hypothetical protein
MASSHSSNDTVNLTDTHMIKFTMSTTIDDDEEETIWENIKVIKFEFS